MAWLVDFANQFEEDVESDRIIIGGGSSGLMAGRNLAMVGKKVIFVERNDYFSGGLRLGGT